MPRLRSVASMSLAGAALLCAACSPYESPSFDVGDGGPNQSYEPATCKQECQDYLASVSLVDTIWLLYNQNVAGRPGGTVDTTAPCPLGGTANISGTVSSTDGITSVQLSYDLSACANSDSLYEVTLDGSVTQNGTFDGEDFTSVTFSGSSLEIAAALTFLDDPAIEETCDVSATQEQNGGDDATLDGRVCGRSFSSVTAFDDIGGGASGEGGSNGGTGGISGAGGGSGAGGTTGGSGCPSVYDGTYIGQFAYRYETAGPMPMMGTGSFNLTITLECIAVADEMATLSITHANASHPYFECAVEGCTPAFGTSVALLPANPPTTPSNQSRSGMGLVMQFPNGVLLGTANQPSELNVTSDGRILSNAVTTSTTTWSAANPGAVTAFPNDGTSVTSFESWSMSKSGLAP